MSLTLFSRPKEVFEHAQAVAPTTDTGWATYSAGSRLFLPAATNLVTDPQGTAQTLWPADSANTDLTPNQALPVAIDAQLSTVTKCIKLVNDGTADNVQTGNITVVASTSYRSRLYIYAPTVGGNITITAETGSSLAIGTITVANAGFVSFGAATNTVGGQTTLAYKIAFAGGTASTIYITAVSLVAATVETPHFDGTYANCAWTGTAHASTSTRTASVFNVPFAVTPSTSGLTIAHRFSPLFAGSEATFRSLVHAGTTENPRVMSCRIGTANQWGVYVTGVEGASQCVQEVSIAIDSVNRVVLRVAAATLDANFNGANATQAAHTRTLGAMTGVFFGSLSDGTLPAPAYIGPIIISPTRKSDAWVTAIQASSGAAYASLPRLWRQYMSAGDLLIPLYGNSTAFLKRAGTGSQA